MKHFAWTLAGALTIVAGIAHAQEAVWVATISTDGRTLIDIVDTTEAGCNAQVAELDQVAIIEACHPVEASRIQDDGTGGRGSSRTLGNVQPNPGSDGGTAAGAGRAVGGAGHTVGGH